MLGRAIVTIFALRNRNADGHQEETIKILNWDHYPIFGPKTAEEAIARVNQAWEDRINPSKWRTSEDMWNQIYEKYPWLR